MKSDLCQIALSWLILPGKLMIDQMDCLPFPRQAAGFDGPITPKEYVRQWPEVYDLCHTFLHVV